MGRYVSCGASSLVEEIDSHLRFTFVVVVVLARRPAEQSDHAVVHEQEQLASAWRGELGRVDRTTRAGAARIQQLNVSRATLGGNNLNHRMKPTTARRSSQE